MANTISNFDDVIDSRDVIARIEELEGEREALQLEIDDAEVQWLKTEAGTDEAHAVVDRRQAAYVALDTWDASSDADELRILKALADEASGYASDWKYGETLIRDSYFKDYAMELGAEHWLSNPNYVSWPLTCIDWDQAARELQMDYSAVDFDGVTYWIR